MRGTRSVRSVAKAAGISEARWRQLVKGEESHGGGVTSPAHGKPSTIVAMARAVGGSASEALQLAGFDEDVIALYAAPDPQPRTREWLRVRMPEFTDEEFEKIAAVFEERWEREDAEAAATVMSDAIPPDETLAKTRTVDGA